MWIFERRENGTDLIPLSDFKDIRLDSDIRKSYLKDWEAFSNVLATGLENVSNVRISSFKRRRATRRYKRRSREYCSREEGNMS